MSSNHQTADEMKAALGIEAPAEETPTSEEAPAADAVAEPPAQPSTETPAQTAKPAVEKAKKNPQERIDKVVYEREEARREAARERAARESSERKIEELRAEWRREFETLKQDRAKPQDKPAADPNTDPEPDYTNTEVYPDGQFDRKYLKDQARWEARQEFKEQQRVASERYQAEQRERAQYERQQQEHQRITTFATKVEGVLREQPELRARIENVAMSRPMWDVVLDSNSPHQLLAYMADHPEEAARINSLPPLHAFKAMSRLEFELDQAAAVTGSAPAKPKTSAHPPVSPVSGSHAAPASGPPDPNTCTQEEFDAYWNAQEKSQRQASRR